MTVVRSPRPHRRTGRRVVRRTASRRRTDLPPACSRLPLAPRPLPHPTAPVHLVVRAVRLRVAWRVRRDRVLVLPGLRSRGRLPASLRPDPAVRRTTRHRTVYAKANLLPALRVLARPARLTRLLVRADPLTVYRLDRLGRRLGVVPAGMQAVLLNPSPVCPQAPTSSTTHQWSARPAAPPVGPGNPRNPRSPSRPSPRRRPRQRRLHPRQPRRLRQRRRRKGQRSTSSPRPNSRLPPHRRSTAVTRPPDHSTRRHVWPTLVRRASVQRPRRASQVRPEKRRPSAPRPIPLKPVQARLAPVVPQPRVVRLVQVVPRRGPARRGGRACTTCAS